MHKRIWITLVALTVFVSLTVQAFATHPFSVWDSHDTEHMYANYLQPIFLR